MHFYGRRDLSEIVLAPDERSHLSRQIVLNDRADAPVHGPTVTAPNRACAERAAASNFARWSALSANASANNASVFDWGLRR